MKSAHRSVAYRCMTVILIALLVVASISATGCSFYSLIPSGVNQNQDNSNQQTGSVNTSQNATAGNTSTNKPVMPTYYNPLTGLASDIDLSATRPVAICIGNTEDALPQFGIGAAEILIEAPIENGITRLVMITNSYAGIPQIGSVRATRPYLLSVADSFGAVSVYSGTNDVNASVVYPEYDTLDYLTQSVSTVFYRNSSLFAPHNLFTSGTRLTGALENFEKNGGTVPYEYVSYGKTVIPNGGKAGGVVIPFSSRQVSQFVYDEENHVYLRMQNSVAHTDGQDGKQLAFTNLILLTCESSIYNKVTGVEFDLNVTGGGRGYYVSEGGYIEILWSRGQDGQLILTDAAGDPLSVNRGKTYIGLVDVVASGSVLIVE